MPGYRAGSAFVPVHPSLKGFQREIARQLQTELRDIEIPVQPVFKEPKGDPFEPVKRRAPKDGEKAGGAFSDAFEKRVRAALASLPEVELDADSTDADRKIAELRRELAALSDKRIGVDIDAGQAQATLERIREQLARISREDGRIDVQANTAAASAQLAAFEAAVRRVNGQTAEVDVRADTRGLQNLASHTSLANSRLLLLTGAGLALGPALVPGIAAVTAALGAMIGPLGAAAVGFGGLALVAAPAISAVQDALAAQEAAEKSAATSVQQATTQRISSAYQAQQAAQAVADAERAVARAAEDGARRVADAQRDVRRAREQAAEAIRAANQRVRDSERDLAEAQRDVRRAQEDLTRARQEAALEVEELRERVSDLAREEESASLSLEEARLRLMELEGAAADAALKRERAVLNVSRAEEELARVLNDATASDIDRQQAELAVREAKAKVAAVDREAAEAALERRRAELALEEAEDRLGDVQKDRADSTKELAKAERDGVDGSDRVRAAAERLRDANRSAVDAKRANQRAQRDLARAEVEAARSVADAERRVADARREAARATADAQRTLARTMQAQQQQQEQATVATDAGTAAQRNLAYAMSQLTPWQRRLMAGWISLREAFTGWARSLEPTVIPVFLRGMRLIEQLLPMMTPIVKAAAGAFDNLLTSAARALKAPFWQQFFDFLARMTGPAIQAFGAIGGNIAKGFAGIAMAFEPLSRDILAGLVRMSEGFARWGAQLGESPGFRRFIEYVRENWPQVQRTFGAVSRAVGAIVEALAPLGGPALKVIEGFANAIASMPPALINGIAGALIGLSLATGAVSAAMTLLSANPIGLAVAALAGLALALVHGYQTSKRFRKTVDGVFADLAKIFEPVRPVFEGMVEAFKSLKGPLEEFAQKLLPPLREAFFGIAKAVSGGLQDLFGLIKGKLVPAFKQILPVVAPVAKFLIGFLGDALKGAVEGIFKILGGVVRFIAGVFRTIAAVVRGDWGAVWDGVKDIVRGAIDIVLGILKTVFSLGIFKIFGLAFKGLWAIVRAGWRFIVKLFRAPLNLLRRIVHGALKAIGGFFKWLWNKLIKPPLMLAKEFFTKTIPVALQILRYRTRQVLEKIGDFFRGLYQRFIKKYLDAAIRFFTKTVPNAVARLRDRVQAGLDRIGGFFRRMYDKFIKPVVDGMKRLITEVVPNAFKRGVAAIERAWTKVKQFVRKPIQAVVDVVYNEGIVKMFNRLSKAVGLKTTLERFNLPKFERGGVLGGPPSSRDNQIIAARSNEAVMVPEWTHAVGGPRAVNAMNRAAEHGNLREMMDLQGFARGGVVGYKGGTFTSAMVARIKAAERKAGYGFSVFQGGFRPRTSYSGGTHMKDAIDFGPVNRKSVAAARMAGIIAWDRTNKGPWMPHIHGIPVPGGGVRLSPSAYSQYLSYKRGGDGLGGRDNGPRGATGTLLAFLLNAWKKAKTLGGWIKSGADKVAEFAAHPAEIVRKFIGGRVNDLIGKISGGGMIKRIATRIPRTILDSIVAFAKSKAPSLKTASIASRSPAAAKNYAKNIMAPRFGWNNAMQWSAWNRLGIRESGWRWNARGPVTNLGRAYGIPQSLPGNKMASAGSDWRTNPATQILWMARYMKGRYGSPLGAIAHSNRTGWYDQGGVLPPGLSTVYNGTRRPEAILTERQFRSMEALAMAGATGGPTIQITPKYALLDEKRLAHTLRVERTRQRWGRPR